MADEIAAAVRNYTIEDVRRDLSRLIDCYDNAALAGNKYLDMFFFKHRIATITKLGINFYQFLDSAFYRNKSYVQAYVKNNKGKATEIQLFYKAFQLYFGSVNSFKPIISKNIYLQFRPSCVLDFSAGWGGRLLGAMSIPSLKYIGIDTNTNLKEPYSEMIEDLDLHLPLEFAQFGGIASDRCKIIFQDAATVDYSQFKYDMVFTSPPYFTLEKYENMPQYHSYDEWLAGFLQPVIKNSYKYMQPGHFCLNIPDRIYNSVKEILGECADKIPLKLQRNLKNQQKHYDEYIYIWIKQFF